MPSIEVTAGIRDSMDWLIRTELHKRFIVAHLDGLPVFESCPEICTCDKCDRIYECAKQLQLEGKMLAAIAQLHDLDAGYIKCFREGPCDL